MNLDLMSLGWFAVRLLVALVGVALVILVARSFSPYLSADGDPTDCAPSDERGVAPKGRKIPPP